MPLLRRAEVSIRYMFIIGDKDEHGEVKKAPIVVDGWPMVARVEINKPKYRVQGVKDVSIYIDATQWEEMVAVTDEVDASGKLDDVRLDAILFDCLWSIVVQTEESMPLFGEPAIKSDEAGRPVLALRRHDYRAQGFHATAEKYGLDAPGIRAIALMAGRYRSLVAPFVAPGPAKTPATPLIDDRPEAAPEIDAKPRRAPRSRQVAGSDGPATIPMGPGEG